MIEIKITMEIPQLETLSAAIEHIAGAAGKEPDESTETVKKPAVKSEPTPEPQYDISQSESEKQYTIEEVRAVFMKCAKVHGKDEVKKILAKLGVTKVTEIKQEDFAKAVKAVEGVK